MKKYILTLIFMGMSTCLQALSLQARLDSILQDPLLERTQLGLLVYDLTADSVLYSHDARQLLRPASTMKLLTAVTAIDMLGANYQFRTKLSYSGEIKDSVLTGDIYITGNMDPMFSISDMDLFVESVRGLGVSTIRGRIIEDRSFKEPELLGQGWCWDDDNPPLSPLLVDRKDEFVSTFINRLNDLGVVVESEHLMGQIPRGVSVLSLSTCSHSLRDILTPMMKESDNLYAESVFYQIAATVGKRPAKAAHARQQIKRELSKAGVSGTIYKIADGSGLSLYNYVTPELMVSLLRYVYHKSHIYMHLFSALPIAGQDGTLEKRMTGILTNGKIRAKTGTLTGISSLAGYCFPPTGHTLAFCIINQGVMKNAEGREFQDKICTELCKPDEILEYGRTEDIH